MSGQPCPRVPSVFVIAVFVAADAALSHIGFIMVSAMTNDAKSLSLSESFVPSEIEFAVTNAVQYQDDRADAVEEKQQHDPKPHAGRPNKSKSFSSPATSDMDIESKTIEMPSLHQSVGRTVSAPNPRVAKSALAFSAVFDEAFSQASDESHQVYGAAESKQKTPTLEQVSGDARFLNTGDDMESYALWLNFDCNDDGLSLPSFPPVPRSVMLNSGMKKFYDNGRENTAYDMRWAWNLFRLHRFGYQMHPYSEKVNVVLKEFLAADSQQLHSLCRSLRAYLIMSDTNLEAAPQFFGVLQLLTEPDIVYLVMRECEYGCLADLIDRNTDKLQRLRYIQKASGALAVFHLTSLVHGGIKPSVFVEPNDHERRGLNELRLIG